MGDLRQEYDGQVTLDALLRVWQSRLTNDFDEAKDCFNIYVDSPFCEGGKCRYCCYTPNIIKSPSDNELKDRYYEEILIDNIREFKDVLSIRNPDTVYFGGGTSSLMSLDQMDAVFKEFQHSFDFRNSVKEKTFEFNPSHFTQPKLQLLMDWQFTHVTLGIQSFHEGALKLNNRSSPGLDRLTEVMDLLEQSNVWYNVDLMVFIYQDDLERDLAILKNDLEITEKFLHPMRITVYPNYYKLRDPEASIENREHTFNKVRKMREVVFNFYGRNTYVEANRSVFGMRDEDLYSNYLDEHTLIRTDVQDQPNCHTYSCSGWPNTNYHQNVLALGGYGKRQPYSYMSNKLCYETRHSGNSRKYRLIYAEPELFYEMTGNCPTTAARNTPYNLREGVLNNMLIYNVPAAALNSHKEKNVTVRSDNARALVESFSAVPKDNLWSLQVLSMDCDPDALLHLSDAVQVDVVVDYPMTEFSRLYQFAELTRRHQVRVTVRVAPGMTKAVKIAQALNFSVKLEVGQPEGPLVDELIALAEYYLRGSTVGSPVEPFHSLFLSFYSKRPTSLWSLQEEDPAVDRYVIDDGTVAFSKRLISLGIPENDFPGFLGQLMSCGDSDECRACEFSSRCQGYFKVPHKGYQCEHVKRLFALLNDAAAEMRKDEERFVELQGSEKSDADTSGPQSPSATNQHDASTPMESSATDGIPDSKGDVQSSFSMRRLDYRLEEFTRHSWANDEAKVVWEPRISKVCACIAELEWRSILEGVRAGGLTAVAPSELETFGAMLAKHGLTVAPLEKIAAADSYVSSGAPLREGEPFNYRCAMGRVSDVHLLESAYLSRDDEAVGLLLGYPSCCIDFFNRVWVDEHFVDTTWPMAQNTAEKRSITHTHVEIPEVSRCNILLRWLGPRMVFHLPCSFNCQPTVELADKFAEIARAAGFHQEMDWLEEILSWPVEWKASNGLAEITTPVGTISTVTDATAEAYRVSYKGGAGCPKTRRRAESFPDDQLNEPFRDLEWYYADNGFRSRQDMDLSHGPIVKLAAETLSRATGNVLDLGCGNGVLLKKICQPNGNLIPWGVDVSSENIVHARLLAPRFPDNFVVSDIFDDCVVWSKDHEFQLVILMLGRLTEVSQEQAEKLLGCIKERARNLLVYAYDDYLHDKGILEELARKTGVRLSDKRSGDNVAMAYLEQL
jgi:hypothetical protein